MDALESRQLFSAFSLGPITTPITFDRTQKALVYNGQKITLRGYGDLGMAADANSDYAVLLNKLKANGLNFTRVWLDYPWTYQDGATSGYQTSPFNPSANGSKKFDLDSFNANYFAQIRSFIDFAAKDGIIVQLTVFNGSELTDDWSQSPYNSANNDNGFYTAEKYFGWAKKEDTALLDEVATTLGSAPNLIVEIASEPKGHISSDNITSFHESAINVLSKALSPELGGSHLISVNVDGLPGTAGASLLNYANKSPDVSLISYHLVGDSSGNYSIPAALTDASTLSKQVLFDNDGDATQTTYAQTMLAKTPNPLIEGSGRIAQLDNFIKVAGGDSANIDFLDKGLNGNSLTAAHNYAPRAGKADAAILRQLSKVVTKMNRVESASDIELSDAGFEDPSLSGDFETAPSGTDWSFTGNAGITGNDNSFTDGNEAAPEGEQDAFIEDTGSVSQTFTATNAGEYTIGFDAAQRQNQNNGGEDFQISIDGVAVGTFTPAGDWNDYTTSPFAVGAGAHTITFQGVDSAGGDNTAFIDDVQIDSTGPAVTPVTPVVPPAVALTAPANLRVTGSDSTSVTLAFDAQAVAGVTYQIESSSDGINWSPVGNTSGTTYTATNLSTGSQVYFEACATDGTNFSDYSNVVAATPNYPAPVAPTNLVVTGSDSTSVSLAFNASTTPSVVYRVAMSTDGKNWNNIGTTTNTNYTATGLTTGVPVYFEVRAAIGTVYSDYTNVVTATPAIPVPIAPENLRVTGSDSTSVSLAFDAPVVSGVDYRIAMSTDAANWNNIGTTSGTTFTATGLTPGVEVYFEVRAANGTVYSAYSNAVIATPNYPVPNTPTNLRVTASDSTSVSIAFDDTNAAGVVYRIAMSTDGSNWNNIGTTGANTFTATGLTTGTPVYFEVRAADSNVYSDYSNVVTATPAIPTPVAPANLRITSQTSTSVSLAFDAPSVSGVVYRVAESTDGVTWNHIGDTSGTTYVATNLTPGAKVWFEVRAANGTVYSAYSNVVNTTVPIPAVPSNLVAARDDSTPALDVLLNWIDNDPNASGVDIARSTDGVNFTHLATVGAGFTSYRDTSNLVKGKTYYYEIRAYIQGSNQIFYSAYSNIDAAIPR